MNLICENLSTLSQQYREQWTALLTTANISCAPEWIESIAKVQGKTAQIQVAMFEKEGQLTAVLPYFIHRTTIHHISCRVVELATNLISYHPDALGEDWEACFQRMLTKEWGRWDLFIGMQLNPKLRIKKAIDSYAHTYPSTILTIDDDNSPYLKITQSWQDYLASKKASFRNNVGRFERRMQALGKCETRWFSKPEEVDLLLQFILQIEKKSWKVEGSMAILETSDEFKYYQNLLPWLAKTNQMRANVEMLDGKPVAYCLCYDWNKTLAVLKTSFDNTYKKDSIGLVVNSHMIKYAFENGYQEFDFLGDTMRYKRSWQTGSRQHQAVYLYGNTIKGRLLGRVKAFIQDRKQQKNQQPIELKIAPFSHNTFYKKISIQQFK